MSTCEVRTGRHPLCDCPEERPPGFPFRIIVANPGTCRGGRIAHPDPLTAEDIAALVKNVVERSRAAGRPRAG